MDSFSSDPAVTELRKPISTDQSHLVDKTECCLLAEGKRTQVGPEYCHSGQGTQARGRDARTMEQVEGVRTVR